MNLAYIKPCARLSKLRSTLSFQKNGVGGSWSEELSRMVVTPVCFGRVEGKLHHTGKGSEFQRVYDQGLSRPPFLYEGSQRRIRSGVAHNDAIWQNYIFGEEAEWSILLDRRAIS